MSEAKIIPIALARRRKELAREFAGDMELAERIERIKGTIANINALIEELKETECD